MLLIGVEYFRGFKFRDPGKKIGKSRYLKNQKYQTSERNYNMLKFEGRRKPRNIAEKGEKSQNPSVKMLILAISEERTADPGISSTNWLSCVERNGSRNLKMFHWQTDTTHTRNLEKSLRSFALRCLSPGDLNYFSIFIRTKVNTHSPWYSVYYRDLIPI